MVKEAKFNGKMMPFHCDYCAVNFLVAWYSDNKEPKHVTCPYCGGFSTDKMYAAEPKEIVILDKE